MNLLLLNPTERYNELGLNIDPETSRIIELYKNLKEHLEGVHILLERGGVLDFKLHRTLFGDTRDQNGPDISLRRACYISDRFRTGSMVQVPNGRSRPKTDEALMVSLEEGHGVIIVAGFGAIDTVYPTLKDISQAIKKKERLLVATNCVVARDKRELEDFVDSCQKLGIKCSQTSDIVRGVWGKAN